MSIQRRTIGTGLTQREEINWQFSQDDPPDIEEFYILQQMTERQTAKSHFARIEAIAQNVLLRAGLPMPDRTVRTHPKGHWTDDLPEGWEQSLPDNLAPGQGVATGSWIIAQQCPVDSEAWYAGEILHHLRQMRAAITQGNATAAAEHGFYVGNLVTSAGWKFAYEPVAMQGQKAASGASKAGKKRKGTTKSGVPQASRDAEILQAASKIREKNPHQSTSDIARKLAESPYNTRWKLSFRTIRRILTLPK